jgi:proteasome lid subunit RPN8/RPN11
MDELYLPTGPERCGFVMPDGSLVEVENIAHEPEEGFEMSGEAILEHLETAIGTWHTHPGETANLSMADYRAFLNFPNWRHFIIGADGIMEFYIEDGAVLCVE